MSEAKVRGVVHLLEPTKSYGQKGFRKRLLVLEQNTGRFSNFIPIEFVQDGCDQIDGISVGDEVEVSYRLNGRKWQKDPDSEVKYFLSCEATNFRVLSNSGSGAPDDSYQGDPNDAFAEAAQDDDDVPF